MKDTRNFRDILREVQVADLQDGSVDDIEGGWYCRLEDIEGVWYCSQEGYLATGKQSPEMERVLHRLRTLQAESEGGELDV